MAAQAEETVVQAAAGPALAVSPGFNLAGVGAGFVGPEGAYFVETAPPDPNGAAGVTQYVQWVNTSFVVFDKSSGLAIYGPAAGNTLWAGFGGPCEADNDGDPIVKFDRAAGRWVMTQVAASGGPPFYQCIAVSTGIDATGSYNRYAFPFSGLNDYGKLAVWSDAYYMSFNLFQGTTFQGALVCALDRDQMLAGGIATSQCFQLNPSFGAVLPSDLDGATPPPAGSPNYFVGFAANSLNLWRLHADFATPANSTLTGPVNLPVAAYSQACNGGTCIPQQGTSQRLDSIADRLMHRLAYRNFGDHEALVVNHTVTVGSRAGVRWYELRNPGGTPTVFQQGTYSPDSRYRWMGSIAMDHVGNIALGYSVSSSSMHPAIRYTGRAPTDPPGAMQAETSIIEGGGSQLPFLGQALSRWGDYTSMAVDPADDCTFWYTNEYLQSNGSFNWSTRIASFVFPSCTAAAPTPDFYMVVTPGSNTVAVGSSGGYSVAITPLGGLSSAVSLSAAGLPAGAVASFSPAPVTPPGSSTLTVTVGVGTAPGTYPITITAAGGGMSHSAAATLVVYVPASAIFLKSDATTQGTWKGVYGADGYAIAADSTNYPAYAQVSFTGQSDFTWAGSTTDVRALQKGASTTDRIASAWYSGTSFTIDVNLIDGNVHRVGLYCLDWDNLGRAQTIDILDATTGNVVESRSISGFANGQYLIWNMGGHALIRVTRTAGNNAAVSGLFFDVAGPVAPDFALAATPASRVVTRGSSATYTVTVSPAGGFTGVVSLSASGLPAGAAASFSPASLTTSGTSTLTVTTGAATPGGVYAVTITGTAGSITHSASVGLTVNILGGAVFARADASTQGTWKGVYGADGYTIAGDATSYPAYAQVSFAGQGTYVWAGSTTDVRALQKAASSTDRIAAAWDSGGSFTIDLNLTDGNSHQVGLYCLDWDNLARAQTIDVLDASTSNVLDSRSVSALGNGLWMIWNLSGHVTIRLTRTAGNNAVLSGLFFDAAGSVNSNFSVAASPASQTLGQAASTTYTVTVSAAGSFSGVVSLAASGLPAGTVAGFNPASINTSGASTLTVTTGSATPAGSYPITITGTSGSLSHAATVTLVVNVIIPAAAVFARVDATTQGTWKGVYGADGYAIAGDATSYPAYAQVSFAGQGSYVWAGSTTDVRALQKAASSADRVAATWYSGSSFTIDVNLTDGNSHQVSLYCLDWENAGRVQTIDILNAASSAVLDTRSLSGFSNGQWMIWNLSGHVTIRLTRTAGNNAVVSGLFFDVAAPLIPDFAVAATPASQTLGRAASTTYTVTVSTAGGFNGVVNLAASGLPSGTVAGFNPASINASGTSTLTVTTGSATPAGSYPITITGTSGSLSHSATVTLVVNVIIPAAAVFAKADATTQGTWKGVYGADGYTIAGDATSYPAYAQVSFAGQSGYVWAGSTTDVRALQKVASSTDRVAATWYSGSSFTIDVNLTDGNSHQVGLYCLDWDNLGRAQTIDILDASTGNVLDSRSVSALGNGLWMIWNLNGHVTIRITRTAGNNAVVSGLFFDAAGPIAPDFAVSASPASQTANQGASATYSVTVSPAGSFAGTVGFSASGLPAGATASFNPASVAASGTATLTVTIGGSTPGGSYTITITAAGASQSHSTTVALVVNVVVSAAATFVKTDTTTQGTWKGTYGADGYTIAGDATSYPAYAQVSFAGQSSYVWAGSTTDARALQKAASSTDRIAGTWYSGGSFTIDMNLMDGNSHQVALYCLDWENAGRVQTIDILDASGSAVLDTRSLSGFSGGQWIVWNLKGHVRIRVTRTGGNNAVVSGVFLDPAH